MATTAKNRLQSVANMPTSAEPWGRQPSETAQGFAAFRRYRDLDPSKRSLVNSAPAASAAKVRQLSTWSAAFHWVARATAWDEHRDRESRIAEVEEVRAMGKRHAANAQAMVKKGLDALKKIRVDELTGHEIIRLIVEGSRPERLARGEPESTGVLVAVDPQTQVRDLLSLDPELARVAALFGSQVVRVRHEQDQDE